MRLPPHAAAAQAQSFSYRDGPKGGNLDTILYYEVEEDYSIVLANYFDDVRQLPGTHLLSGWVKGSPFVEALQAHVTWIGERVPPKRWDFVELVDGVLTVKQGYRWDGASTIGNDLNWNDNPSYYLRGSCLHDSLYDLMRMGYLSHDTFGNLDWSDTGYKNRLMADCLMQMVFKFDGEDTGINEFKFVRLGGANKTKEDATNMAGKPLLAPWKYHVSDLIAEEVAEGVGLRFQPADDALRDPAGYGLDDHIYYVLRRDDENPGWRRVGRIQNYIPLSTLGYYHEGMEFFFTDTEVEEGRTYEYRIDSGLNEAALIWDEKHYDVSNVLSFTVPFAAAPDPDPDPRPGAAPEPGSVVLLGLGLASLTGLAARGRSRRRK